ncbi:MAG: bacteriohemerythrin [Vallitaleaceae bacterium]|jgi:hemerythrin|nr:bacteriohemerythrin [Vallitaleaceae bacterium]
MNKIAIFEDTNILKMRIVNILMDHGYSEIDYIKSTLINMKTSRYVIEDVRLLIIDLDNYSSDPIAYIAGFRAVEEQYHIPIIALSKSSDISDLKKALVAGCTDFILKPFTDDTLLMKAQRSLGALPEGGSSLDQYRSSSDVLSEDEGLLVWIKDYEIGVEEIDQEHKEIIQEFEKLYQLMKEGLGHEYYNELIDYLTNYVNWHFDHEEELQKSISYPHQEEHHRIHEELKSSILTIAKEHKDKVITNADLIKINIFLKNWLIHHILMEDRKIAEYIKNEK